MTHMMQVAALLFLLAGCGGVNAEITTQDKSSPDALDDTKTSKPEITELHRIDLDRLLAGGPASILAMIQTDPFMKNGKFKGFTIVTFHVKPPSFFDLRSADVVQKINDLPIERPEHYFKIFEGLKSAGELKIDILRNGEEKTLIYPILP